MSAAERKPIMKKPVLALLLAILFLATACAAGEQAPAPSSESLPEPESPSSVSEPAPEPESVPEPAPESESAPEPSQPEEPAPESEAPSQQYGSYENPDTSVEGWVAPPPTMDDRDKLENYLVDTLTDEEYTSFYWREEGIGVMAPNIDRVKEVVAAYDGPAIDVEYCEVAFSKARLDAARLAFRQLAAGLEDTSEPLICNSWTSGRKDDPNRGLICVEIHQMHPALQEFLDTSGYGECFAVNVTGADTPIVNPDT